jgi:hypothetical protein
LARPAFLLKEFPTGFFGPAFCFGERAGFSKMASIIAGDRIRRCWLKVMSSISEAVLSRPGQQSNGFIGRIGVRRDRFMNLAVAELSEAR